MDVLLMHLEQSAEHMNDALRNAFVRSFLDKEPEDWNEKVFETQAASQELVLEKASRILTDQEFNTNQGADPTSAKLQARLQKSYSRNEGFLAVLNGHLPSKLDLRFDVEITVTEGIKPRVTLRMSRRLPTWVESFRHSLARELATVQQSYVEAHQVLEDVILGPGEQLKCAFKGMLLDYSGCAKLSEVNDLVKRKDDDKALPLGVYSFDPKPELARPESLLCLGKFGEKPMEYNGTLIVAPQNSGKTKLIVRWAIAANRAGYNLFIVDVKGNLLPQLRKSGLQGDVHYFSTSPDVEDSVDGQKLAHFNILEELDPRTPRGRSEIRVLSEAILPKFGGEDEQFWPIRVKWLTAMICLQKLRDIYYRKTSDLSEIYELATTESVLYERIREIKFAEAYQKRVNPDVILPEPSGAFWANELAAVIDQDLEDIPGGQREPQYTYATLLIHVAGALIPFYRYGVLYNRIRGKGDFKLSDLDSTRQTTVILAAREHDGEDAQTLSSMVLKRLEQILKQRFSKENPDRRILLLLDETRRIRGFSPGKYITFAREAKAGCVLVYQSIEQIENEKEITEVLENVGTQIYLRSVTGTTADKLLEILPKRFRPEYSRGLSGFVKSSNISQQEVPCISKTEMYKLPAGRFPALVFIKDHGEGKPILVDMWDERIEQVRAKLS
ncbi:MAG TPA: type IV secretory system conjugative DNA transfer family protein [Bryobacteraceae bacterium]|nr:type IV secretory system conjugative DNA transfer family protein [Bryobacteraceae bacterium]